MQTFFIKFEQKIEQQQQHIQQEIQQQQGLHPIELCVKYEPGQRGIKRFQ